MKALTFVVNVGILCTLFSCTNGNSDEAPRVIAEAPKKAAVAPTPTSGEFIAKDFTTGRTVEATISAARETWNEVAFEKALPQAIPIVKISVEEMKRQGSGAALMQMAAVVRGAHEVDVDEEFPRAETVASKSQLPQIDTAVALAAGTRGAYFSSSRLIPQSARLAYPYSASGKIFFKQGTRHFICSGSVINSRVVVTAGHCVHKGSDGSNGFYSDIIFVPAWHEAQAPFGVWAATWVATTFTWGTGGGGVPNAADFAVFEVADQEIDGVDWKLGDMVGTYGFKTAALLGNHLKIIGYPGSFDNGNIMHQVDTGDSAAAANNTVLYGSDMTGGSSGGPWIQNFGEKADGQPDALDAEFNTIVGITSYGFISSQPKVQGSSILNDAFVSLYNAVCARNAGNCD